ncbi:kinase domain-containing protein [Acephala macrosclerotiorum]|nr:kinase domain-containing protein [Acephala macrosclerotiorum]
MVPQDRDYPDYGEFVDSDEEGDIVEEFEPWERYNENLYYLVCIGKVLAGRYRIKHKLGWGGFSTVWMAHDVQDRKDVALKIMVPGEKAEYEYQMQNEIIRTVRDTSHLVTLQGSFLLPGHGGNYHRVLVLPLLIPSLGFRVKKLPVATRVSAAKQLLVALKGLHDVGLVHRDLNEGALMWEMPYPLAEYDTATKYQRLGRSKKVFLGEDLWKRGELVQQVAIPLDLVGRKLYLGDFGLTIKDGTSVRIKGQATYHLCAPERLHGADPSLASDTWSYMCLFGALYLGTTVFYGNGGESTAFSWVEQLCAMPEQWKGTFWWQLDSDEAWYDQTTTSDPERDLADRIARMRSDTSQAERELVLSVMLKAFCYLHQLLLFQMFICAKCSSMAFRSSRYPSSLAFLTILSTMLKISSLLKCSTFPPYFSRMAFTRMCSFLLAF